MSRKLNIGFLGMGQCGGNIADLAEKHGYRTAVINTAQEDLDAVENVRNKLLIGTQLGCGKDRNVAKSEVKSYHKEIVEFVRNTFSNSCDIIYVVTSASGGTGSGMSPIVVDLLRRTMPTQKFGIISILPSLDESVVSQFNTLEHLNEVMKLNLPTLLVDNEKFNLENKLTKKQLYDTVNDCLISDFNLILKERPTSKYGNLDGKDLSKVLLTNGNIIISTKKVFPDTTEDINRLIIESWDSSIYTELENDNAVKRMGFIFEIPDTMTKFINYNTIQLESGKPLETFEGFYVPEGDIYSIVSIMSGLSYPEKRINKIKAVLEESKQSVNKVKTVNIFDSANDCSWFGDMRQESSSEDLFGFGSDDGDLDLDNLFNNY